jgi:hypothetical protein
MLDLWISYQNSVFPCHFSNSPLSNQKMNMNIFNTFTTNVYVPSYFFFKYHKMFVQHTHTEITKRSLSTFKFIKHFI